MPTTRALLEDLATAGHRGTFMIVGWVAEHFPALVREIRDAGHEIGLHGHWHRRVYELSPEGFREDLRLNIAALRAAGAGPIVSFRAPEWSLNQRAPWALADSRRGRIAHRRQPGAGGARRVAVVPASAASDCHDGRSAARSAAARGAPGRACGAARLGMGPAQGRTRDRHRAPSPRTTVRATRPSLLCIHGRSIPRRRTSACRRRSRSPTTTGCRASARVCARCWQARSSVPCANFRTPRHGCAPDWRDAAGRLLARWHGGGRRRRAPTTAASRLRCRRRARPRGPGTCRRPFGSSIDATDPGDVAARVAATAGWPVWLTLTGADAASIDPATWPDRVRAIVAAVPTIAAVELQADGLEPRRTAFLLKVAAAEIRARSAAVPIVLGGGAAADARRDAVVTADVAPSIDGYVIAQPARTRCRRRRGSPITIPARRWSTLDAVVPDAGAARAFLADAIEGLGLPVTTRGYRLSAAAARDVLPVAARLRDVYAGDVVPVTRRGGRALAARRWRRRDRGAPLARALQPRHAGHVAGDRRRCQRARIASTCRSWSRPPARSSSVIP